MACLPNRISCGCSCSTTPFKILATSSAPISSAVSTKIPRSAPSAIAERICSCASLGPMDTTTISETVPFSFKRTASSTAISQNGLIDILTLVR